MKESEAPEYVLNYLQAQARPFNVETLFQNFHRAIAKGALERILDDCCEGDTVVCKAAGKSKIYFAKQAEMTEEMAREVQQLGQQDSELQQQLQELRGQITAISAGEWTANADTSSVLQ